MSKLAFWIERDYQRKAEIRVCSGGRKYVVTREDQAQCPFRWCECKLTRPPEGIQSAIQ